MNDRKKLILLCSLGLVVIFSYQNCSDVDLLQVKKPEKPNSICHHAGIDFESNPNLSLEFSTDDYVCEDEAYDTAFFICNAGSWEADSRNANRSVDEFPFLKEEVIFDDECTEPTPTPTPIPTPNPTPSSPTFSIPGTGGQPMTCGELPRNENTESYYEYQDNLGPEPQVPSICATIPGNLANGVIEFIPDQERNARIEGVTVEQYRQAALRQGYDLVYARRNTSFNNAFGGCGNTGENGFGRQGGFSKNEFVSLRFKTKNQDSGAFDFSINSTATPHPKANVLYTISKCPGDFGHVIRKNNINLRTLFVDDLKDRNERSSVIGASNSIELDACMAVSTYAGTLSFRWATTDAVSGEGNPLQGHCMLNPNETYYLNVIFRDSQTQAHTCRTLDIKEDLLGIDLLSNNTYSFGDNCSIEYVTSGGHP